MRLDWQRAREWFRSLSKVRKTAVVCLALLAAFSLLFAIGGGKNREVAAVPDEVFSSITEEDQVAAPKPVNHPPEIRSSKIVPQPAFAGDLLQVELEVIDPESDYVYLDCEWRRNGEVLFGEFRPSLATEGFRKGDVIALTLTPSDSWARGEPSPVESVVLGNHRPLITSTPPAAGDRNLFIYQVNAEDRDKDVLAFSLAEAPPGMSIQKDTGLIQWPVSETAEGYYNVRIIVSDGEASTSQDFTLQLK